MTPIVYASVGLFVLSVLTQIPTCDSLNCFQCNSTTHAQCLEQFDHDYSTLKSSTCAVSDARFCVKVSGAWGGVVGTYRFCSSRDMGNQCQYFGFDDHDRHYRACVRTCDKDSCNSGSRIGSLTLAGLVGLLVTWVLMRKN